MGLEQSEQPSQNSEWVPSITIRAHHTRRMASKFRRFFLSKCNLIDFVMACFITAKYSREAGNYWRDAYGPYVTNPERDQAIKSFEDEFKNLPNNAVAKIGVLRDAICNTCPVGKHCTADNYVSYGMNVDVLAIDGKILKKIHKRLTRKGFLDGVDFKLVPTTEDFLDYQGQNLWSNSQQPISKVVEYDALLVKMGSLRKVI